MVVKLGDSHVRPTIATTASIRAKPTTWLVATGTPGTTIETTATILSIVSIYTMTNYANECLNDRAQHQHISTANTTPINLHNG